VPQCVRDLAKALGLLVNNDEKRMRLCKNGRKRVEEVFDWEKREEDLSKIYMNYLFRTNQDKS
jgi:glycosyltransferase involved in cell wall biosynthesis